MSDIKEVIGKVNGMPVLKKNTIITLQKDIRDLKNLMRSMNYLQDFHHTIQYIFYVCMFLFHPHQKSPFAFLLQTQYKT